MKWQADFAHMRIASDLDGTLLDYNYGPGDPQINHKLLMRWALAGVRQVAFVSNQGGLPFGIYGMRRRDERAYPTPELAARRLAWAIEACAGSGITVVGVTYCVWHPRADSHAVERAARRLRKAIQPLLPIWRVYAVEQARKPSGLMLRALPGLVGWQPFAYYGDSEEDRLAADDAKIPFEQVERFLGR